VPETAVLQENISNYPSENGFGHLCVEKKPG
jgi:hypothetical protein